MKKIDITDWKEFAIGELFNVVKGTRLTKANMKAGEIRFIGSSSVNNGVTAYISNIEHLHPANTITVCYNGSVGETFYQDKIFWTSDDVNVLYPRFDMTLEIALFIIPIIKGISREYNFINKWKQEVMSKDKIKLPVTESGQPDWCYMDRYMTMVVDDMMNKLASFEPIDGMTRNIKINDWKEFAIGELFDKIVKPPVLHSRQIVETENGIPYVVRTKFDNGIKCRVKPVAGVEPSPAGVISWGAENATFFYQEEPFLSGRDIYYIDTTDLKPMTCRFLTACLQKIASKYPYNYGLFPDLLKEERIKLPITDHGKPDWGFMNQYMTQITESVKDNFNAFEQLGRQHK